MKYIHSIQDFLLVSALYSILLVVIMEKALAFLRRSDRIKTDYQPALTYSAVLDGYGA